VVKAILKGLRDLHALGIVYIGRGIVIHPL